MGTYYVIGREPNLDAAGPVKPVRRASTPEMSVTLEN
jgi:hypothetical protein